MLWFVIIVLIAALSVVIRRNRNLTRHISALNEIHSEQIYKSIQNSCRLFTELKEAQNDYKELDQGRVEEEENFEMQLLSALEARDAAVASQKRMSERLELLEMSNERCASDCLPSIERMREIAYKAKGLDYEKPQ